MAEAAIEQRAQSVFLEPARGEIFDRNGAPLNAPSWTPAVAVFPTLCADQELSENILTQLGIKNPGDHKPYVATCDPEKLENVKNAVGLENFLAVGIIPVNTKMRYGSGSIARHVVGYLADMAENRGVAGIELAADELLTRKKPRRLTAYADGSGERIPWLSFHVVESSSETTGVYLTIDKKIQAVLEATLAGTKRPSAGVVLEVATGDVVAMASTPGFDQNSLADYLQQPDSPFLNRAVQAYTPGSVFKLVTVACALEERLTRPGEVFSCDGKASIGSTTIGCSKAGGHGRISLEEAFAQSCNVTFIELGRRCGARRLLSYAARLGLGKKTELGLPDEQAGCLPDPTSLYLGDLANISIGQGAITVTPLQIAAITATIAAGGIYHEPRLISRWVDEKGHAIPYTEQKEGVRVLSEATAIWLQGAMSLAVQPGRTGAAAFIPVLGCAGKTGSAETGKVGENGEKVLHSWFSGYAPSDQPRYAACIFVEEGGYGGSAAAPAFKELMGAILNER
ncbi:MAG TPA: penicillin-binding protein 2 [Firmicutes bacterium]|nr:penicillin-binding protein 2 [Bacillota bacterium]